MKILINKKKLKKKKLNQKLSMIFFPNNSHYFIYRSNIDILKWNIEEVANWIDKLPLSQSYSSMIKSNFISGVALRFMKTREDWTELGITVFGDQQILVSSVQELFNTRK